MCLCVCVQGQHAALPTGVLSFQLRENYGGVTMRVHKSSENTAGNDWRGDTLVTLAGSREGSR